MRIVYISQEVSKKPETETEGSGSTPFPSTGNEESQLGQLKGVEEWIGKEMSKSADGFVTRKPTSTNTIKNYLRQLHKLFTLSEE